MINFRFHICIVSSCASCQVEINISPAYYNTRRLLRLTKSLENKNQRLRCDYSHFLVVNFLTALNQNNIFSEGGLLISGLKTLTITYFREHHQQNEKMTDLSFNQCIEKYNLVSL